VLNCDNFHLHLGFSVTVGNTVVTVVLVCVGCFVICVFLQFVSSNHYIHVPLKNEHNLDKVACRIL